MHADEEHVEAGQQLGQLGPPGGELDDVFDDQVVAGRGQGGQAPVEAGEQYANNPIEADHSQLKHRLRPMRGLRTDRSAQVVIAGHAFVQNLRRGHYDLATDIPPATRLAAAFIELAQAI